jgi:fatty-acyl-CoA synthase
MLTKNGHPRFATLADIEAYERVPVWERFTARSTYDIFRVGAEKWGKRPALHFLPRGEAADAAVTYTYRDMFERITRTANMFRDLGVGLNDPISYLLPNLPETHFTIWGGETAGIVNAINPLLQPAQIVEIMRAAKSKRLIALGPVPGTEIWDKAVEVRKLMPEIETVLQVMGPGDPKNGVLSFDELLAKYPGDRLAFEREIGLDDLCSYFHTGGTTGAPKIAPHRQRGEVIMGYMMGALADLGPNDVLINGLPLFHVNAVVVTGLGPWTAGSSVVIAGMAGFRNPGLIRDFWKIVERFKATTFSAVPTIYAALLNAPIGGADVSSLRYGICGAAPMPVEVIRNFEAATGVKILEGYGLTEGTTASSFNPRDGERRIGSIGLRIPYQRVKPGIVDDAGAFVRDCKPGEIGAILIAAETVFPGYLQEQHNKKLWAAPGLLNTGDLGRIDEQGYLWLTGRAKDLIIRGGHNIDPSVIEETLHLQPAVALAAAVGKPDLRAGELPMAYVQLKPGAKASADELRDFAKAKIAERAAAPVEIVILERIPVTAVGKIFKPDLRCLAIKAVCEAALAEAKIAARVDVGPDPSLGTVANVALANAGDAPRVDAALGGYAFKYKVA